MARIAGINIPMNKHVWVGLTHIFGVGRTRSKEVCALAGVPHTTKVKDLTETEVAALRSQIAKFLVEGDIYQLVMHEQEVLGLRPPKRVVLTVDSAEEVARGSTVSGVLKSVTLDNGAEVNVPAFIKEGDRIAINPENGEYIERVT